MTILREFKDCIHFLRKMNKELKEIIREERSVYLPYVKTMKNRIMVRFTYAEEYLIYSFVCALRRAEFYQNKNKLLYVIWLRIANRRGSALGFFIPTGVLGRGVHIFHGGEIIINANSVIGDGCLFHGGNCVGNNGRDNLCPVLGKRVDIGVGAKIIGNVTIADDIKIGANAVVTRSFLEPGITLVGIPARKK